ncbi:MAG: site-specific DNA-methyltransferase [Planctomycetia bacterium]|nr:site-specific DNA-methyltransferase [Planctomycetia bacterium]
MELIYPGKITRDELLHQIAPAKMRRTSIFGENCQIRKNRLYHGDNLPVLKTFYLDQEICGRVQLVYIDPPYASNQSFQHRKALDTHAYHDDLSGAEYVESLRRRLIVLRELLAEDGAIYVHLDSNMAFHVKVIMDEIFGPSNFRNWITRKKCHSKNYTRKQYGNVADYILFYSKSAKMKWNRPCERENIYTFEQRFPRIDKVTGRRYALVPIHAPGTRNGATGKPWRGMSPPAGKHWQVRPVELDRLDAAGEIYWSPTGNPRRKIFADQSMGVAVQDLWTKFMDFRNQNMKETGYPTEKNGALLRRIIKASSDPGDVVLDCYCGSGTTLAVARDLGRRWIGVDASELAIETTAKRLQSKSKNADQLLLFDSSATEQGVTITYESSSSQ